MAKGQGMNLGVQYYRPPFPDPKYWADDFARIRDSGLDTVQLWVLWGWVEARPGRFEFDDYDRLIGLAEKTGLGVVLSTIAEIQPYWIGREVPGCDLVAADGRPILSTNRCECHFGITPGGCFDHPGVWERMRRFLKEVATRYRAAPNLRGWDAWNETRWNVNADALVCYCDHTLAAFRRWLDERYGGLEGLNRAWKRRYGAWDEVQPGRGTRSPYTEMMAFEHFLADRAVRHAAARYEVLKPLAAPRPVTIHGPCPCIDLAGGKTEPAMNRGNDWGFADSLDGVGTSSFPLWFALDDADFGYRVEAVHSAARGKQVWLSEVQGGRASTGFNLFQPVPARNQQRWIWNGLACGAHMILFWCWRDEVFGYESAGFGLAGDDGLAEERLAAMRKTGAILRANRAVLEAYRPLRPEVGLLFSPQAYYLAWAEERTARRVQQALVGYARALTRRSIPYLFVEEEHLDVLKGLKVLLAPRALVTDPATEKALEAWVRAGGTLLVESECGAFDSAGLYRYPADRFTARLAGIREVGRRSLVGPSIAATVDGAAFDLPVTQWLTPWQTGRGEVLAAGHPDGNLLAEAPVGKGRLVLCGSYLGDAYRERWSAGFEGFLEALVRRAGVEPPVRVLEPEPTKEAFAYIKTGRADDRPVVFVFFPRATAGGDAASEAPVRLGFPAGFFASPAARDLISAAQVSIESDARGQRATVPPTPLGLAVLVGG
jgi:beta-galactosidase